MAYETRHRPEATCSHGAEGRKRIYLYTYFQTKIYCVKNTATGWELGVGVGVGGRETKVSGKNELRGAWGWREEVWPVSIIIAERIENAELSSWKEKLRDNIRYTDRKSHDFFKAIKSCSTSREMGSITVRVVRKFTYFVHSG